jgi:hypothetical protein
MNVYDYYIKFSENEASTSPSIAYLNKIIYVAYTEATTENYKTLLSKEDLEGIDWLDATEKAIITKGFDCGLTSLYVRGAINENYGQGEILALSQYKLDDGSVVDAQNLAYTIVISPRWSAQALPSGFSGVLVNSVATIPTVKPGENIVNVYDPYKEGSEDKTDFDGKALGIMATFLAKSSLKNMQFTVFNQYSPVPSTGVIQSLKDVNATFIFNDGINNMLGMFACAGNEIAHPYISELWRYNVRESLRAFLQVQNPTYINDNILIIDDLVDKVCEKFLLNGYFSEYQKTVTPLKDGQLASDIDKFLVNNVKVAYNTAGAIWNININVSEVAL